MDAFDHYNRTSCFLTVAILDPNSVDSRLQSWQVMALIHSDAKRWGLWPLRRAEELTETPTLRMATGGEVPADLKSVPLAKKMFG